MFEWTEIGGFHNVRKTLEVYPNLIEGDVTYRAKIKLHGTNAGVSIDTEGNITAQSRTSVLTPKEDNSNFCKECVVANEDFWSKLNPPDIATIFGEWCGPGIMKGTAINKIPQKMFAIFAIQLGPDTVDDFGYSHAMTIIDPRLIANILSEGGALPSNVCVVPWLGDDIVVDFTKKESMQSAIDIMNDVVETVERIDPWVKDKFEVEGIGEGVVYYPVHLAKDRGWIDRHDMKVFSFKAKGEKHKNIKTKNAVQIDPEVAASIDEYVTMVVTPSRLDQGARAVADGELDFNQRYIGSFIKWMCQDVLKETTDELAAAGLTWDQVSKPVTVAARTWYLEKFKEL